MSLRITQSWDLLESLSAINQLDIDSMSCESHARLGVTSRCWAHSAPRAPGAAESNNIT